MAGEGRGRLAGLLPRCAVRGWVFCLDAAPFQGFVQRPRKGTTPILQAVLLRMDESEERALAALFAKQLAANQPPAQSAQPNVLVAGNGALPRRATSLEYDRTIASRYPTSASTRKKKGKPPKNPGLRRPPVLAMPAIPPADPTGLLDCTHDHDECDHVPHALLGQGKSVPGWLSHAQKDTPGAV
jgi:hypothetical protein